MAVLWNPRADIRDFLTVIEGDPALTSSVLRAANSAYSAPRDPIHSARHAIVRIGLESTRQITSAAVMRSQFEQLEQSGLNVPAFWQRQLVVGLLVEDLARHDQRPSDEVSSAFVAGLLHRVGRLPLAVRSPDRYREAVELVRAGLDPLEAEHQVFGIDAATLTRQVAARWDLPDLIADALSNHDSSEVTGLPLLLHEAIEIAELLAFDEGFAEAALAPAALPAIHPRAQALEAAGGLARLRTRVDWFTEAAGHHTQPRPTVRAPQPVSDTEAPDTEAPDLNKAA